MLDDRNTNLVENFLNLVNVTVLTTAVTFAAAPAYATVAVPIVCDEDVPLEDEDDDLITQLPKPSATLDPNVFSNNGLRGEKWNLVNKFRGGINVYLLQSGSR